MKFILTIKHLLAAKLVQIYYRVDFYICILKSYLFKPEKKIQDYRDIPIIINNRNRLSYLQSLVLSLENKGYRNIIILDNDSTYPPLLSYYEQCPHRVCFLKKNLGYKALMKCDLYNEIKRDYFVYTDPDVVPIEECPNDFLNYFWTIMKRNVRIHKVGFSLKIDDLPEHYLKKQQVIAWETNFYQDEIEPNIFRATIDTTFALHRPWSKVSALNNATNQYRVGFPFQLRHLPWYEDDLNPTKEEVYYKEHAVIGGHWTNGKGPMIESE